jgi:hypothetical protein
MIFCSSASVNTIGFDDHPRNRCFLTVTHFGFGALGIV